MNGTQMKPAFCSHSRVAPPASLATCGSPPSQPNTPAVITSGTTNCTTLTPRLPSPALSASALPFSALGKKKRDVGHRRGEVAAAEAAEQRQHQEDPVGRVGILHGIADAGRREDQRPGGERRPQPAAEDRHHEGVEDAQRRARQAGQRRQPEQLVGGVGEADRRQLGDDDRPHHPDGEGQQQRRDRDPQIAPRDRAARLLPERLVLGPPVLERRAGELADMLGPVDLLHLGQFGQPGQRLAHRSRAPWRGSRHASRPATPRRPGTAA